MPCMEWAGFFEVITVVSKVFNTARQIDETINDVRSNPGRARYQTYKRCQEKSEQLHREAKNDMEKIFSVFNAWNRQSEANITWRHLQKQEENKKAEQKLFNLLEQNQKKQDDELSRMNAEHDRKMRELRVETEEERENAEKEHKAKIEKLENKQKEERTKIQNKLETTRREGAAKINDIEWAKQWILRQREWAQSSYNEEMKKLTESQHKHLLSIRNENRQLKLENSQERLKQLQEANQQTISQIDQRTQDLLGHFSVLASREVIVAFQTVIEPFCEIRNSLSNIGVRCIANNEENPVLPGQLDPDIEAINEKKNIYRERIARFRQFLSNSPRAHRDIREGCNTFIRRMSQVMYDAGLSRIFIDLPDALSNNNFDRVQSLGSDSHRLSEQIRTIEAEMDANLHRLAMTHEQDDVPVTIEPEMEADVHRLTITDNLESIPVIRTADNDANDFTAFD